MKTVLRLGWIAGACAIVGLIVMEGAGPVFSAVQAAGWAVLAVLLLRTVAIVIAGVGWHFLFPRAARPSALSCILVRFIREGANALLPMSQVGGDVIGARVLVLRGTRASLAAASIIVDVLVQAATQIVFALAGIAALVALGVGGTLAWTVGLAVAGAALALAGFFALQRGTGQRLVKAALTRLAGDREWLSIGAVDALYGWFAAIYADRRSLWQAAAVHLSGWFIGVLEVWAVLTVMGYPAGWTEALVIESLMQAVRAAAFAIPGALGAQEGALIALCALFGVPAEAALALSLVKRVPDIVLGVPGLLGWQFVEGQNLRLRRAVGQSGSP